MDAPPPFMPTQFGNFSMDQWSNPYSQFYGQALPWPSSYVGAPNDAYGQPIASYTPPPPQAAPQQTPGLSLATPQPAGSYGASMANFILNGMTGQPQGKQPVMQPGSQGAGFYGQPGGIGSNADNINLLSGLNTGMIQKTGSGGWGQDQPATARAATSSASPAPPNNWAAALSALANPGPLRQVGATVPQSQAGYQPGPGVLQHFMANWSPAQSGPGSGFQQGFAHALAGGGAPAPQAAAPAPMPAAPRPAIAAPQPQMAAAPPQAAPAPAPIAAAPQPAAAAPAPMPPTGLTLNSPLAWNDIRNPAWAQLLAGAAPYPNLFPPMNIRAGAGANSGTTGW